MTIQTAIRSQSEADAGAVLQRANEVLSTPGYFQPEIDPHTRAANLQAYVKALLSLPLWAVMRGFDDWVRTGPARQPTPGDIRSLAEMHIRPITDEIARRRKVADQLAEEEAERQRKRVTPEAAARIMQEAGFTEGRISAVRRFPLSKSQSEAVQKMRDFEAPGEHWSDKADPDGPEWAALRASRAASGLLAVKGGDTT